MTNHYLEVSSFPAKKRRFDSATMRLDDWLWNQHGGTSRTRRAPRNSQLPSFTPMPPIAVGPNVDASSWGSRRRSTCTTTPWTPEDFVVEVSIGQGHFGGIMRACIRRTGATVALKTLNKFKSDLALLRREINIHSHLHHPHIVPLHGYYETITHVHLVLAYAPSSDLLNYQTRFRSQCSSEDTMCKILVQLCQALQYLEICQVAHRDVKPENILVISNHKTNSTDNNITIQLADFGWATWWRPHQRHKTLCGTAEFCPPEMLQDRNSYSAEHVDRWMLGVLTVELIEQATPFDAGNRRAIFDKIRNFRGLQHTKENQPPSYQNFVDRLLQCEPTRRMSATEALEHDFLLKHLTAANTVAPVSPTVAQRRQLFQQAIIREQHGG